MDDTAVDYTRSLYDRHANKAETKDEVCVRGMMWCVGLRAAASRTTRPHSSSRPSLPKKTKTKQALRARQQGAALPLKQYHNRIKRELINAFAGGAPRLLDLACGRGGDLHKWVAAGVGYVRGVDLSPGEIQEARRRYGETKAGVEAKGGVAPDVEFEVVATLGTAAWSADEKKKSGEGGGGGSGGEDNDGGPSSSGRPARPPPPPTNLYDAVSCMFAAHYFFSSEASARRFLTNVAAHLKPGGFFFGTVPSGRKVQAAIRAGGTWPLLDAPALRLEARWSGEAAPFGSAYTCAIKDTVTAGHEADPDTSAGSLEYLVFSSAFTGLARVCGLEPVINWSGWPALEALLDPADEQAPFKAFVPSFPGSDPSLERASELFVAFCFRRTDAPVAGWEREVGVDKKKRAAVADAAEAPPPPARKRVAADNEGEQAKKQRGEGSGGDG
jgi:SAM-dependent methyltransferase